MVRTGEHIPLPPGTESIAAKIVDAAYTVPKALGPGLLENVYEVCNCHELKKRDLSFQRQVSVPITYDEIIFYRVFRLDVLVEGKIICEIKNSREPERHSPGTIALPDEINRETSRFPDKLQRCCHQIWHQEDDSIKLRVLVPPAPELWGLW